MILPKIQEDGTVKRVEYHIRFITIHKAENGEVTRSKLKFYETL